MPTDTLKYPGVNSTTMDMSLRALRGFIRTYLYLEDVLGKHWRKYIDVKKTGFNYHKWLREDETAAELISAQNDLLTAVGLTRYYDVEGNDETAHILWWFTNIFKQWRKV